MTEVPILGYMHLQGYLSGPLVVLEKELNKGLKWQVHNAKPWRAGKARDKSENS